MKSAAVLMVAAIAAGSFPIAEATMVTLATIDNYPDGCSNSATATHTIIGKPNQCVPFMGRVVDVDCDGSQVNVWRGGPPPFAAGQIPDDWIPPPPPKLCGVVPANRTFPFQCTKYLLRSVGFTCTSYNVSDILEWKTNQGRCEDAGGPKPQSTLYVKLNTCQVPPNFDTDGAASSGRLRRRLDQSEVKELAEQYGEGRPLPKGCERGQPVLGWGELSNKVSYLFAVTTTDNARFVLNGFFWNSSTTCGGAPARTFSVPLDLKKIKNETCHDHDEGGDEAGDAKPPPPQTRSPGTSGSGSGDRTKAPGTTPGGGDGRRALASSSTSNSFTALGDVTSAAVVVSSTPTSAATEAGAAVGALVSVVAAAAALAVLAL